MQYALGFLIFKNLQRVFTSHHLTFKNMYCNISNQSKILPKELVQMVLFIIFSDKAEER